MRRRASDASSTCFENVKATLAPAFANAWQKASPSPRDPPVTRQRLPSSRRSLISPRHDGQARKRALPTCSIIPAQRREIEVLFLLAIKHVVVAHRNGGPVRVAVAIAAIGGALGIE